MKRWVLCCGVLALCGCASGGETASPVAVDVTQEKKAQGQNPQSKALEALGERYWELLMSRHPTWATFQGDRRFDTVLYDPSSQAREAHNKALEALLKDVRAIDTGQLTLSEQITVDVLSFKLETSLAGEVCQGHRWQIDQLGGPQVSMPRIAQGHFIKEPAHAWTLVERYKQVPVYFERHIAELRSGLADGYTAPRIGVERVIAQVKAQLAKPANESPYVKLAYEQAERSKLGDEALASPGGEPWRQVVLETTDKEIYPALRAYLAFLEKEALPASRQEVGVSANPNGQACYEARVWSTTGLKRDPAEIHALGLAEVERIKAQMMALIEADGGKAIEPYLQGLAKRPEQVFKTEEELISYNTTLVERADAKLASLFGRLPSTPVEVKAIESFRAADAPIAYYEGAAPDGSHPAYYYVNTFEPETRPRYIMAVLAYHEAVPGHHLQIALAEENQALPRFQREIGQTAFVEGWALYAEALSWEAGLYHSNEEKLGALSFEMWRAVRLVVDTGMHTSVGWSREQALRYLMEHTGKYENEAANEIDRYIVWPGQALAYKIGQLEIMALRQQAKEALGDGFVLPDFHDEVLRHGAVPLATLRARIIEPWIEARKEK